MKKETKFKKMLNKVKGEFKDLLPAPELACAGIPIKISVNEVEDEKTKNLTFYHTGPYPKKGSIQREIMEKKEVRVFDDKEDIQHRDIDSIVSPADVQKELNQMLNAKKAAHEYIAFEATKMFNDEEIVRYTIQIVAGAKAEDYNFMPGETLDDLFAEKPRRRYKDDREFAKENDISNVKNGFLKKMFRWVSKMADLFTSTIEHDVINRPYMTHFFKPNAPKFDRGLDVKDGEIKFKSAAWRATKLWDLAVKSYEKGAKSQAYTYLGHYIHLVSDMHVPAHVHNDIHAPWPIDKKDPYEEWCGRSDYDSKLTPRKQKNHLNISVFRCGFSLKDDEKINWDINSEMNEKEQKKSIVNFFEQISHNTQYYKSLDFAGWGKNQEKTKTISNDECFEQAKVLIPRAIYHSALVIERFKEVTKQNK